ncbi:PRKR-interacting protein 1 [Cricetulus griseus]|uniref:PRKR-interacting protein 1 n=1 Tax=Cricetulus griseus TaxID=10029 RepID=G3HA38_CRIGR|nr:PRKR-interacting protein 1 [Cricetulus griseus]ERE74451.1 PRKR-interacting protein 1 [Cricetulus griseus]
MYATVLFCAELSHMMLTFLLPLKDYKTRSFPGSGSSAGAGSGEFHVYRHLRRREYQRQDYMDAMAEKQKLDAEFQKRLEKNKIAAEEQTAKRRKKRQKLKEKKLMAKKMKLEQKKQKEGEECPHFSQYQSPLLR